MPATVAIYARVSTLDQDPDLQLFELRQYVKSRRFKPYREYIDRISSVSNHRPQLAKLLNDARKKKFDTVLVWRFDRFARSTKELLLALEEFQHLGIDFISYRENVDTASPAGKVMFTLIGAMAEFERSIILERVIAGMAKAKAKGKKLGRPRLAKDLAEQIRKLRRKKLSLRAIAKKLKLSIGTVHNYLS